MNVILKYVPHSPKVKCFVSISLFKINYLHITSIHFASVEDTKTKIFQKFSKPVIQSKKKVSIIGVGQVGIATAVGLLAKNVTSHIALFDTRESLLRGEMLDLQHGSCFLNNPKIEAGTDPSIMRQSRVCVLTIPETPTKTNTDMCAVTKQNADILVSIVPKIFEASPDCVLVVATQPVEAMTYVSAKIMCNLPKNKIIGVGCSLDTMRLKHFMAKKYRVDGDSCNCLIVGQHRTGSVVLWSTLSVGGNRICAINPEDWKSIHQKVIDADSSNSKCISWAAACNIVELVDCILNNSQKVFCLSVPGKGYYCISSDLYVSLPCVLGEGGVTDVVTIKLTENENAALIKSLEGLEELQKTTCV